MSFKPLKAVLILTALCPVCGETMYTDPEDLERPEFRSISCSSEGCPLRDVDFLPPEKGMVPGDSMALIRWSKKS
jgi:C4-type Zn-finger protein